MSDSADSHASPSLELHPYQARTRFASQVGIDCQSVGKLVKPKKLPQPIAICTECGECTGRLDVINQRCLKEYGGRRCEGVYENALADRDWRECSKCSRTGY